MAIIRKAGYNAGVVAERTADLDGHIVINDQVHVQAGDIYALVVHNGEAGKTRKRITDVIKDLK